MRQYTASYGATITPDKVCDIYDRFLRELAVSVISSEVAAALENNELEYKLDTRTPGWPTPLSTEGQYQYGVRRL